MVHITINGNIHFSVNELVSLTVTEDVVTVEKKVNDGCLADQACGREECEKSCPDCEWYDTCLAYSQEEDEEAPYVDGDIATALEIAGRQFNEAFGKCEGCICDNECIACPLTNVQRMNSICPAEEGLVFVKLPDNLDDLCDADETIDNCMCYGICENCDAHLEEDTDCRYCKFNKKRVPAPTVEVFLDGSIDNDDVLDKHRCADCQCKLPHCTRECLENEETGCMNPTYGKPIIDTPAKPLYECGGRCEAKEHGPFDGCYAYFDDGKSVEYGFINCSRCPNKPKDTGVTRDSIDLIKEWKTEALPKQNGEITSEFSNMFSAFIKGMRDGLAKYMKNNEKQSDNYTYGE